MSLPDRIMGIDYGRKRIGVAVTDPLGMAAHPVVTLARGSMEDVIAGLRELIDDKDVRRIVIGLPLNMDGSKGSMAREVERFGADLGSALELPVAFVDERLSSVDADDRLKATGMHWQKRKQKLDQVAAALILETWMSKQARG